MSTQTDLEISASIAEAMLDAIPDAVINAKTEETIQIDFNRAFAAMTLLIAKAISTANRSLEERQNMIDSLTQKCLEDLSDYEASKIKA